MSQRQFHHGNLRAELIELASRRIEETGIEGLSLRELAAAIGVSPGAPYRHFSSKEDLLHELAEREIERLGEAYRKAQAADLPPRERFKMACRSYLEQALQRPQSFRMVFMTDRYLNPTTSADSIPSYALFVDLAVAASGHADRRRGEILALTSWAMLHGFAIIRMDSRMPSTASRDDAIEAVLDRACRVEECNP
ncbi:TetR/AcrR family transcriptional regulator [Sphingomonas sp. BGYR3]|uniref:TetR/AcrR family transcriptional regulator n=1 Tax=Sphingomonas sp. BGYR3 TaxID=2975483 RepID=UPI0021A66AC4|nr:TetR/AcrR family transcriptional regulator [Sphingomonas sp. BGYR3]MDG5487784.1 TetR/AcrR family transcriptional regulator [Sphingomonas sp. BGYR3]